MNLRIYFKSYIWSLMLPLLFLRLRAATVERPRDDLESSINDHKKFESLSIVPHNNTASERNELVPMENGSASESLLSPSPATIFSFDSKEIHPELNASRSGSLTNGSSDVRLASDVPPSSVNASNLTPSTSRVNSDSNSSVSFENASNTSEENIRSSSVSPAGSSSVSPAGSSSVSPAPAVPLTPVYQPVVHLENVLKREFYRYLSMLKNPFLQKLANKLLKSGVTHDKMKSVSTVPDDYLSQKQLRSVFKLSKHAVHSLFRCRQPESTVTVKCISNIARITFTSDSEAKFNAKASIYNQNGNEIPLEGYKLNAYIVWWRNNKTESELCDKVTKEKLERKCNNCRTLEAVIKLEGSNHACLIPVTCQQPHSEVITFDTTKLSAKYFVRNAPVIASSLAMHDPHNKDGNLLTEEIPSGNDVQILIQATADTIPVGVFVRECKVTAQESKEVMILINGCSISALLDNFRGITSSSEKNDKFMIAAKFTPFTMKNPSQNLTLGCFLKICEGMCDIHSCQTGGRPHPQFSNSRIIKEVYLETTYRVLPEHFTKGSQKEIVHPSVLEEPRLGVAPCYENETDFLMRRTCYSYLFLTLMICVLLLVSTVFYYRGQQKSTWHNSKYIEEMESTPRTFYSYDSNARRRSPTSSSIVNFCD